MPTLEERVDRLENLIENFSNAVALEFNKAFTALTRVSLRLEELAIRMEENHQKFRQEMKESHEAFKQEIRETIDKFIEKSEKDHQAFKEEIRQSHEAFKQEIRETIDKFIEKSEKDHQAFKEEMRRSHEAFKEEMKQSHEAFKEEMKQSHEAFKEEMRQSHEAFKEEMRQEHREMNKRWGELSNKLGTIVEDIIFPATEPVLTSYFKCEISDISMNKKKKKGGLKDEFDVVAVSDDAKTVFLIEVKATPKVEYINDFKTKKIDRFRQLFTEYSDYKVVPIFASLRLEEDIVNYLTKNGIYAMAYREWEYMDILNFDEINSAGGTDGF